MIGISFSTLSFAVGVPQVQYYGSEGLHNVLVIDLLGPNLEDLFDMCNRKFSIKTVCMAAKQMVSDFVLEHVAPSRRRSMPQFGRFIAPVVRRTIRACQ
jgi:hypothetical protein